MIKQVKISRRIEIPVDYLGPKTVCANNMLIITPT